MRFVVSCFILQVCLQLYARMVVYACKEKMRTYFTSWKVEIFSSNLLVHSHNIFRSCLEVSCSVIRFSHENLNILERIKKFLSYIIISKVGLRVENILSVDEFLLDRSQLGEGGFKLALWVCCLGGGGDKGEPFALWCDIVGGRDRANVNV